MGRINNSVEIIPIDGPSGLPSRQITRTFPLPQQRANFNMNYIADPYIVPRVRQYLEANVDKTYVDITEMADFLQNKFKEYSKRKRSAFRGLVKRAYTIVLRSYGREANQSSSDLSDVEDVCDDVDEEDGTINNQLLDMYRRKNNNQVPEEQELIDISSDDSSELPDKQPQTNTNGAASVIHEKPVKEVEVKTQVEEPLPPLTPIERGKKRKAEKEPLNNTNIKRKKDIASVQESKFTFKDVGGMDKVLEEICKLIVHIKHSEIYRQIGISPPRGFLLHGPPGCGKTLLANAVAGELGLPIIKVASPELVAGVSGESEERIRELFETATASAPCILFIDEIDAITPNRQQAQKEMERRIVAQLLSCLDDLGKDENGDRVLVIGATNRPDALDPALRRAGRFDREVCLGIPSLEARIQILKVLSRTLKLAPDFDYSYVAKCSPGFVGADLMALTREASVAAINRVFKDLREETVQNKQIPEVIAISDGKNEEEKTDSKPPEEPKPVEAEDSIVIDDEKTPEPVLNTSVPIPEVKKTELEEWMSWLHGPVPFTEDQLNNLSIQMGDFDKALKSVQPSAKREGFATVPDVTWDDVGSLQNIREELQMSILAPVRHAEQFKALGLSTPTGLLLCGPPGCGKTLLAKAIANEAGINFISVKGPELLNMYVGESERAVRLCFQRAKNSAPCVIFFDEIDSLCPKRSDSGEGGASMRVVNQMLTEMDGVEDRQGVFLMAASNRPDIIDPAVLRPGRLDKILYVGLPTPDDRVDILRAVTKKGTRPLLALDVDLEAIGKCPQCEGYTGADLAALVREAGVESMKQYMLSGGTDQLMVTNEHFQRAIDKIRPSVTEKTLKSEIHTLPISRTRQNIAYFTNWEQKHYEKLRKLYSAVKEIAPSEEEIMECS